MLIRSKVLYIRPVLRPLEMANNICRSNLVASVSIPPINASENDIPQARRQSVTAESGELSGKLSGRLSGKSSTVERQRVWPVSLVRGLALVSLVVSCGLTVWQWEAISAQVRAQTNGVKGEFAASRDKFNGTSANAEASGPIRKSDDPPELLHHRRYAEAPVADLVALNSNSEIKLQPAAAASVNKMIEQARSEGILLGVVSGFRSIEDQDYLFFEVKAERGETPKTRAEVSAPPGYSEHHTGYAVDFVDESQPDTYTEESFERTAAYRWLMENAAFYNFEMSFPKDPMSPLSYEPWHWRYVGNQESLELFYKE